MQVHLNTNSGYLSRLHPTEARAYLPTTSTAVACADLLPTKYSGITTGSGGYASDDYVNTSAGCTKVFSFVKIPRRYGRADTWLHWRCCATLLLCESADAAPPSLYASKVMLRISRLVACIYVSKCLPKSYYFASCAAACRHPGRRRRHPSCSWWWLGCSAHTNVPGKTSFWV